MESTVSHIVGGRQIIFGWMDGCPSRIMAPNSSWNNLGSFQKSIDSIGLGVGLSTGICKVPPGNSKVSWGWEPPTQGNKNNKKKKYNLEEPHLRPARGRHSVVMRTHLVTCGTWQELSSKSRGKGQSTSRVFLAQDSGGVLSCNAKCHEFLECWIPSCSTSVNKIHGVTWSLSFLEMWMPGVAWRQPGVMSA